MTPLKSDFQNFTFNDGECLLELIALRKGRVYFDYLTGASGAVHV